MGRFLSRFLPRRNRQRVLWMLLIVLLAMIVVAVAGTIFFSIERQSSQSVVIKQPTAVAVQQQPAQQAPVAQAVTPCEPAESLRCRELRGEIPSEPEIKGLQIGFGPAASGGPSLVETFGWWTLAALVLAVLVAGLTQWTIQQTAPIAVGLVVVLLVLQNWWIFFAVVGALVLMLVAMAVRNLLASGAREARRAGVGNLLPQGMSLIVIWEIIQTLWSTGTVGAILGRVAGNQNQPPAQPPAQNP